MWRAIDSQSVKTTEQGGEKRGYDGGKKISGRKRHILVDSMGMLLAVLVTSAAVDDGVAAKELMAMVDSEAFPRLRTIYGDNKYHNYDLYEWMDNHVKYRLHIVRRPEGAVGFERLPQRWIVERTFAWLARSRRLAGQFPAASLQAGKNYLSDLLAGTVLEIVIGVG